MDFRDHAWQYCVPRVYTNRRAKESQRLQRSQRSQRRAIQFASSFVIFAIFAIFALKGTERSGETPKPRGHGRSSPVVCRLAHVDG
jgi:hypothetical protein